MASITKKKTIIGKVISNAMDKTIIVASERKFKHPVYGKYIRRTSKFYAHDPENKCTVGNFVKILETRPLSKKKRWRLLEVIGK